MTPVFAASLARSEARRQLEALFAAAGLADPRADAAILLEEATGLSRANLLTGSGEPIGAVAAERLQDTAARRLAREPVFRILGQRPFWTLDLMVTGAVLDPRPDTETIVTTALSALADRREAPLRVLDLGTGSGAILCALLSEWPAAWGLGVDRSHAACRVARSNAQGCGLDRRMAILCGDWDTAIAGRFDVVVSNPPYIETATIATLDPEVRDHDPRLALDGGPDGLAAYRRLGPALPALLAPGGLALLEVGWTQAEAVAAMLDEAGLGAITTHPDGAGHARVVAGRQAASR